MGRSAGSLYQITRCTLSPGIGGTTSQGNCAIFPATACAWLVVPVKKKKKYICMYITFKSV